MSELKVRTVHRGRQHVRIKGPYSAPRQAASEFMVRTVHLGRQHVRIKGPYSAPRQAACQN